MPLHTGIDQNLVAHIHGIMSRDPLVMYPNEYPPDTLETPLWLAAKLGCYDDVIALITGDQGVGGFGGYMPCSPLGIAAVHNHADIVLERVKHGADLLSKD